jgi:ferredoxin-NADP reductase
VTSSKPSNQSSDRRLPTGKVQKSISTVPRFILPVRDSIEATPRTRIITIDLAGQPFSFAAGQAVYAGLADGTVRRPYSIASSPSHARTTHSFELLVQIDNHEGPDPHLERAVPGTLLRIDGPMGSFGLPENLAERHLLFIAGGTGIAPLRSMMWETLATRPDVDIGLIYSARNPDEFAYRDQLVALADDGRIDLRLTTTREAGKEWTGGRGRADEALIRSVLKSAQTRCLVCGPPLLIKDASTTLRAAGVPADLIVSEAFSQ